MQDKAKEGNCFPTMKIIITCKLFSENFSGLKEQKKMEICTPKFTSEGMKKTMIRSANNKNLSAMNF